MRKIRTLAYGVLATVAAMTWHFTLHAAENPPTLEEALGWFHRLPALGGGVNAGKDPQRFKKLTVADLKATKELTLGGHLLDANGKTLKDHLTLADADYRYLTALPALEVLKLPENNIGDEGLKHLGNIKSLKKLLLMENRFTAAGLQHLAGHKGLAHLDLRWNKQLDDTAIPYLVQLKHVKELTLFQTSVSPAGIKRIQEALPACKIVMTKTEWR